MVTSGAAETLRTTEEQLILATLGKEVPQYSRIALLLFARHAIVSDFLPRSETKFAK